MAPPVGVPGTQDVICPSLLGFAGVSIPQVKSQLSFFTQPQGQAYQFRTGAGAVVVKTVFDTNMITNNQLSLGNEFYAIGSETLFFPGVNNATSTTGAFALEPSSVRGDSQ